MIIANVILRPSSDLRRNALDAIRNISNRHCRELKTVHIMAKSSNPYQGYPKIPIRDSFK